MRMFSLRLLCGLLMTAPLAAPAVAGAAPTHPKVRTSAVAAASGGAYLTVVMGRTVHAVVDGRCRPIANSVSLPEVARQLQGVGLIATGAVVLDWIGADGLQCHNGAAYPSWTELGMLRDNYRWSFVSEGPDHVQVDSLTRGEQYAASCGSLQTLAAHGHTRAWGMFAYPGGSPSEGMQQAVTQRCFAYGRTYLRPINTPEQVAKSPFFQHTMQVYGGSCQNTKLPCSRIPTRHKYMPASTLQSYLRPAAGQWSAVQVYKFVKGSYGLQSGAGPRWDCTAADWRAHWTTSTELYCLGDFLAAARGIPAGVTVTDPAGVAQAWSPHPTPPSTTITSGPGTGASATFTFSSSLTRSWYVCSLDGAAGRACDSGVTYASLRPGEHSFSVRAISAYGVAGPGVGRSFRVG